MDSRQAGIIALLDDSPARLEAMRQCILQIAPLRRLVAFDNAPQLLAWLQDHLSEVDLLSLDHDLGVSREIDGIVSDPGDGRIVAEWLSHRPPRCPVIVHSSNGPCARSMMVVLELSGWQVSRAIPDAEIDWVRRSWQAAVLRCLSGGGPTRPNKD